MGGGYFLRVQALVMFFSLLFFFFFMTECLVSHESHFSTNSFCYLRTCARFGIKSTIVRGILFKEIFLGNLVRCIFHHVPTLYANAKSITSDSWPPSANQLLVCKCSSAFQCLCVPSSTFIRFLLVVLVCFFHFLTLLQAIDCYGLTEDF